MYRALIICNSRYPDDPSALGELHGPKVDGVMLRDALSHHDTGMFDKNDVRMLSEGDSLEVSGAIDDFFSSAESDDILLFYYSGHGRSWNQQLFLCARNTVVARLHSTAISGSTLNGMVSCSFAQVKILILDCCFSGLFKGDEIAKGMSGDGRYVIAATSATDRASDSKLRGLPSPFTSALADALLSKAEDRDRDGAIDLDDIFSYLINLPFEGTRPQRNFDGSGAIPIARRIKKGTIEHTSDEDEVTSGSLTNNQGKSTVAGRSPGSGTAYLDNLAPNTSFSSEKISDFRRKIRNDVAESMPQQLTAAEFLQRAGLLQQGNLTYAGLLLFGDNPTTVMPSAIVQCVRFYGTKKNDPLESIEIQDTVPETIVRARDFVANHARLGETPTSEGAYSEAIYKYPMIAVREIIANAIVHRDYEQHDSCVQILVFTDRIEIISPGEWSGSPAPTKGEMRLGKLERSSHRRNFRLAQTLTWSRLVEGVGAGIPRAIADCRAMDAPEPMVKIDDCTVVVTIFPRPVGDASVDSVAPRAAPAPLALAQLPASVAGITGRDAELAMLIGLLNPTGTAGAVIVSAVAGLAGVGKTTLAVQAGHAARDLGWFGGGVLFLDLHGYDDQLVEPGQALDALLRALGVSAEHIPPRTEERAGLYRSVLAEIHDPILMILDNVSSEAQVRPLLPGDGPHKVVVTSRHTLAGLDARLIDIAVLDGNAAIALLDMALRAARPDDDRISGDRDASVRLADVCGGLPLALQVAASLLKADPALSAAQLADELAVESARLRQLRYDDGAGPAAPSVAAAFELSYRRLDEISGRVFRLLPVNPGPEVSTEAVAVMAGLPASRAREILKGLARAHLIEIVSGMADRWHMHDLLRLYAGQLSEVHADSDGREDSRNRLLDYYLRLARAADACLRTLPDTALSETFTDKSDALAWLDLERTSLVGAVSMAVKTGRHQIAIRLPITLAEYLNWRRRFDDMLITSTISLDTARRLHNRSDEGAALTVLGNALREVRRFEEAITACQDAAAIFREVGDRRGEGQSLGNLGAALREVRRFEEAIAAHQEAAAIFRETGDRRGEGQALGNLGNALREVGRFEEAITACQDAAAIFPEVGDRRGEGQALGNLGAALQEVRRFKEAITACRDAAAIFREVGDRRGEGQALGNLGAALQEVRRFEEAITAHQEAAVIFQETGDRHGEGIALVNLGNALSEVGQFEEAITALQEAAVIFQETGDRHGEGIALVNLGNALSEVGQFEEAITALQEAAVIFQETGDRHGEGIALVNLGNALSEVGQFEEAITAYQGAAAISREIGDQRGEGQAFVNLGVAMQKLQRFEEAITAHQRAAAISREIGDQRGEGQAFVNLGVAMQKLQRFEEAITAHQRAAAILKETADRYDEAIALVNLGNVLREVGRGEEAITVLQEAAAIRQDRGTRRPGASGVTVTLEGTRATTTRDAT